MMMVGRGERLDRMSKHRTFDLLRRTMRCGCKKKKKPISQYENAWIRPYDPSDVTARLARKAVQSWAGK